MAQRSLPGGTCRVDLAIGADLLADVERFAGEHRLKVSAAIRLLVYHGLRAHDDGDDVVTDEEEAENAEVPTSGVSDGPKLHAPSWQGDRLVARLPSCASDDEVRAVLDAENPGGAVRVMRTSGGVLAWSERAASGRVA